MIATFRRILRRILVLVAFVLAAAAVTTTATASARTVSPNCFLGVHGAAAVRPDACGGGGGGEQLAPYVVQSPADTTVAEGGTAYFTSVGYGQPLPTIQWFYSADDGATWNSALQYTPTFELDGVIPAQNNYLFEAVYSNDISSATTWPARLTVVPATRSAGISPAGVDFGTVGVGQNSIVQTETVTNTGNASLLISSVTTSDPQFVLSADTCTSASLAPAQTCTVDVAFAPTGLGEVDGTLTVSDPADSGPQSIPLTGIGGSAPALTGGGLVTAGVNEPFSRTLAATGFPAPTVTLSGGLLPPGVTVDNGVLGGAPTRPGYYTAQFVATNGIGTTAPVVLHIKVLPKVTLTMTPASLAEGNSGLGNMFFLYHLSRATTAPLTFHYATHGGTATGGQDYVTTSGTVTLPAGIEAGAIDIWIKGDTRPEADEQFTLVLSQPQGVVLGTHSATGTIVNDD